MNQNLTLSGQAACSASGCSKLGMQCVEISAPVTLTPSVSVGTVTTTCQGSPAVTCQTDEAGTSCTVTVTQRICVSIPVQYSVSAESSARAAIACAEDCACQERC